ncbi:MAG: EthD family reductase [Candidatus Nanopelagicales bacterium]|jgi:uncharacterized protein (TIGR02118 family)
MFKAMIMLTRRADMTHHEFARWWLDEHAPMARRLPGVREIRFNEVPEGEGIDGITELWFDDQDSFEAAYASEIGKTVAQDSLDHVSSRVRLFVNETHVFERASDF